jgi:hypothetical protein
MDRPTNSSEGALLELVARGQKDVYFISQEKTALNPFSYSMTTWPATLDETRQTQPLNTVEFGRTVEWEMDSFGDLLTAVSLVINLPTWLPPMISQFNGNTIISDSTGATYGYTQGIAAFLFEQIEFYQDQVLLQQFSGDFLYAWSHFQGTLNKEALHIKEMGGHTGSALDIQRNATPGKLILRLPLIGCAHPDEGGLPFIAVPGQKYRIRCKIRRLEDLIECSNGSVKPKPWLRTDLRMTNKIGTVTPFIPLTRENIGKPLITLETTQRYVRSETQALLKKTPNLIPFIRPFENKLSLDPSDYVAVGNGVVSYVTKRIDGRHPGEGILLFFQSEYYIERNQLWNFNNPLGTSNGNFYNTLKLTVAGKDRETDWDPSLWQNISPWAKSEKNPGIPISWISFTIGPSYGYRAPERRKPSGTLNFSSADKPTIYMNIKDTLPCNTSGQKRVTVRAITIGWGIYRVEDQRGTMLFGN